jgi:hypothetical protein
VDEICNRILENYVEKEPFPEEEERRYHRYRSENPPRTKAKGIAALYYYYCYELHIIVRFPASVKKVSATVREDIRKLDRLDEHTRFLATNGIENHEDLDRYRSNASDELTALKAERDDLRNKLKRVIRTGDETAVLEVKKQIAAVSDRIKKLKTTFKICDSVEERALRIQEQLETLYDEQPERKENSDELFRRRGGTSRKDVPKRR